ncbi:citrate lyase subunit beta/citryl-CoA lyase [Sphingomonas endophytica]|uniref:Citrate lyase subunit beta/citryl-CoA lyase n=1 Tax=Sphingomonas endophytica TaxID=869719 RepID=A0A7X0MPL1_9SPHN|nr:CoA ester lyase [Sphingomonas endophytica]MBB6506584.1 citrate lyase subunit beta/citryl-CoA lyase [Sphingomonas endophytica]
MTNALRPRRSALFLPASNARAIEKARALPCDVVILDLEDAVAPAQKEAARAAAVAAIRDGGFGARELAVRANALDTPWGGDDLMALGEAAPDAVVLPKLEDAATLSRARAALGDRPALWAMIETCAGVLALPAIVAAAADHGLAALIAGTNDLARELRCRAGPDRTPLLPALGQIVLAARAAGLVALDGVINTLDDQAAIAAECAQARAYGFDGKTLIHPAQIAAANDAFGPADAEVAAARTLTAAFDGREDEGAIRVDGRMVERLHLEEARRVLALAEAIAARDRPPLSHPNGRDDTYFRQ